MLDVEILHIAVFAHQDHRGNVQDAVVFDRRDWGLCRRKPLPRDISSFLDEFFHFFAAIVAAKTDDLETFIAVQFIDFL